MRYLLYLFTMALLFAGGVLVGNIFLPQRAASLAAAVSVPPLNTTNTALVQTSREQAQENLELLNQALSACPVVVGEEKDRLLNQIKLRLAIENFELKKLKLELEIAKNQETNRTTSTFTQASVEYKQAKERAEALADTLFPMTSAEEEISTAEDPSIQAAQATSATETDNAPTKTASNTSEAVTK